LIRHRKEFTRIEDDASYKLCRVQWYGQGVILRSTVLGIDIKTKAQQVCRAGDFLVAEIDAKEGGFGVIPPDLSGAIVSGHYFLFDVDRSRLDTGYLSHYVKTPLFRDQVKAQGSTNYSAIRPSDVLMYTIPLPQIEQQRCVVEQLSAVSGRHTTILRLRQESQEQLDALCRSMLFSEATSRSTLMSELVSLRQTDTKVERHKSYSFAGVYCFGKGVFKGQTKNGTEFAYDRLTQIRSGEFTYPKLMAWEGALGVVPEECDRLFVSPEYPVFRIDTERLLPEVLDVYYRTPSVWPIIGEASTGTNVRRRRLHPSAFLNLHMPVPSRATQVKIRQVRRAVEAISAIRRKSEAEVKALLNAVIARAFDGGSEHASRQA
jgi:type I restriction enzyme, S subunit